MSGNAEVTVQQNRKSGSKVDPQLIAAVIASMTGEEEIKERTLNTKTIYDSTTETIILPEGMSKIAAAEELMRQHENEEQIIELSHKFDNWMYEDVLVAIKAVSTATFGWIQGKTVYSFFGAQRPAEMEVITDIVNGHPKTELCFHGRMGISAWEDAYADIGVNGRPRFAFITLTVKKKFTERVRRFFKDIELHLSNNSIYKGKSIVYQAGMFQIIENKPSENIILNDEEERVVNNLIIKALGKQEKRSVLFSGPFGTGKTETAMRVGVEGNKKGLTFFYCKEPETFSELLVLAKNYQPAIIFLEDVDDIGGGSERTTDINELLNTLDGVQTKNHSLTCIFTTNHADRINPALRRPGRIDLVVQFGYLSKESIGKLYRRFFENQTSKELDYQRFSDATPEHVQGAIVAEMAKRALQLADASDEELNDDIILDAIVSMKHQIEFLRGDVENVETPEMKLYNAMQHLVDTTVTQNELVKDIRDQV